MHLPENAFRELKPGERYEPLVPATEAAPETTARSIVCDGTKTPAFLADRKAMTWQTVTEMSASSRRGSYRQPPSAF